jgi:hypothetical protein
MIITPEILSFFRLEFRHLSESDNLNVVTTLSGVGVPGYKNIVLLVVVDSIRNRVDIFKMKHLASCNLTSA